MKNFKIAKVILAICVCLITVFALFGCSSAAQKYQGTKISKITFNSVDYFGGYTVSYLFDFDANTASKRSYLPSADNPVPEYEAFADFTEAQATQFMDSCYGYGLFSLEKSYVSSEIICDGGGWSLTLEYVDGTTFTSNGDNAAPDEIFSKCKYAFYDLCKEGVVGNIPSSYINPPALSVSFCYSKDNVSYNTNELAKIGRGNFCWNGNAVSETSYYEVNQALAEFNQFDSSCQYELIFYTANYDHDAAEFFKCTLTCYDFNEEMSNAQEIFSSFWFRQKEFALQFNKIYVYRLYWSNGDFAEYTFNTKLAG